MLYHIEIEFQDSEYNTQIRIFDRADSHTFDHDRVDVRQGTRRFHMRDVHRVIRFEAESLADRVDKDGRDDLDAACAEMCAESRRIQAIKLVRETLGYGLKESKDYVDTRWPYVNPHAPERLTRDEWLARNRDAADLDIPF